MIRPNGAYKFLVHVMYDQSQRVQSQDNGTVLVPSIRKVARMLGTDSSRVNGWVAWLQDRGYIESVAWSQNRRSVSFLIRRPTRL